MAAGLPQIPMLTIQLFQPGRPQTSRSDCLSILDTGSDCTLLPLPLLIGAKGKPIQGMTRIPVVGMEVLAIPVMIGLRFDDHELLTVRVYGCSSEEFGDVGLIGRDILNRFRIDFDGPEFTFYVR